jgi:hypothetical protein
MAGWAVGYREKVGNEERETFTSIKDLICNHNTLMSSFIFLLDLRL